MLILIKAARGRAFQNSTIKSCVVAFQLDPLNGLLMVGDAAIDPSPGASFSRIHLKLARGPP
jgi:hypothetical protein